ncbi:cobalt-precorrin-6A reductase [Pontivivens ytuae]|uniref:Cobalt-precorrin-6A reductase n=1 Tax=Pontivivens ytuae TaxID=2789856 RepID=A0A7S9LU99_9RHOB|nr:cobalt-precorrin-6A reductase [Pontivivens ytuae]QPH55362.1 cobalt-precorrin-6A reductase [Pontivivens ytuae]
MTRHVLILGGTTEARALCDAVAARGIPATLSYAGRVARPAPQAVPVRVGGFGGTEGLTRYLTEHAITEVVDATHPFAAQMSGNAVAACAAAGVPLIALTRPPWQSTEGDRWTEVADLPAAVEALAGPPQRVMLAVGRMHLAAFAAQPQHDYLLRLVDPPEQPIPLPKHHAVISRGPFKTEGDIVLLREHRIERIVAKNAGGSGAVAKIEAARALGLPIVMIARPPVPARREAHTVAEVLAWLDHVTTDLGV